MTTLIIGVAVFVSVIFLLILISFFRDQPLEGSCGSMARMFGLKACMFCGQRRLHGECPRKSKNTDKMASEDSRHYG